MISTVMSFIYQSVTPSSFTSNQTTTLKIDFFKKGLIYFDFMYDYSDCMYFCVTHLYCALEGQKMELDFLELE